MSAEVSAELPGGLALDPRLLATRKLIGVSPASALESRPRLFAALEAALPVRFEAAGRDASDLDGLLVFAAGAVRAAVSRERPELVFASAVAAEAEPCEVTFTNEEILDGRLRGQTLGELHRPLQPLPREPGDTVLAAAADGPVWIERRGTQQLAQLAPPELGESETLRDLFRPGRWLSLLPLVHFLRAVTAELAWTPPPLRAAFLFDDPNLHWPSYGRLHFAELARAAKEHGYHASIALVPLDARFGHPGVVRLFREQREYVSILIHGNNHIREELFRPLPTDERWGLLAQALRRIEEFERRNGIDVDRVMAAPHGFCAEEVLQIMFALDFDALTADWPFPWSPAQPLDGYPLAGWEPAQLVTGGFPVLPRYLLSQSLDDLVLRAFLDQPLILYGHHATSLELLAEVAQRVNALGAVQWGSVRQIARANVATRQEGSRLHVRPFARRVQVELPAGIDEVVVEAHGIHGQDRGGVVSYRELDGQQRQHVRKRGDGRAGALLEAFAVDRATRVELRLDPAFTTDPRTVPAPPWRPWPVIRRALTESRDRLLPFLSEI